MVIPVIDAKLRNTEDEYTGQDVYEIKGCQGQHQGMEVLLQMLPGEDCDGRHVAKKAENAHQQEENALHDEGHLLLNGKVLILGLGHGFKSEKI